MGEVDRNTVVHLREYLEKYFESRLVEMVRHYDFRFNQLEKSRDEQAADFERRLGMIDETQRTKFPTREDMAAITDRFAKETEMLRDRFGADIATLKESRAELAGRASQNSVILAIVLALAGIAIGVIGLFTAG